MRKESLDKLSPMDGLIQRSLYWPDGSRRKYSDAAASKNTLTQTGHLLKAVVDKYNDDHKLSGDCAYELKDVLNYQTMREGNIWYSHFNFTTKAKGAGVVDNLFFAEVVQGDEMVVTCFCMINTDANGRCYGCINNGSFGMKHPKEANTYNAGHPDAYLLSECTGERDVSGDDDDEEEEEEDDEEDVKAEVDRLRHIYKGLDDPLYLKKISTSPYATATFIED